MWSEHSNSPILRQMRTKRFTFLTVYGLGFLIVVFFFSYFVFGNESSLSDDQLEQIHVIFRHGDKTPTRSFVNDIHANHVWSEGPGALTNKGKKQLYQLGLTIREVYGEFLTETYDTASISIKSSYAARCQMSAMVLFAALFPPKNNQIWNSDLLWQPIPVNPIPRNIDNLIAAQAHCVSFTLEKRISDYDLNNEIRQKYPNFFESLSTYSGTEVNGTDIAESIFGVLKIQKDNGLELPKWAESMFPSLRAVAAANLASYTRTTKLKRLQSGPLLKEILYNLEHWISLKTRGFFYSAHDRTLVTLMRTLGLVDDTFLPEYGAALVIELHKTLGDSYVKILYFKSSSEKAPKVYSLPNCGSKCPLRDFKNLTQPFIPNDWNQECNS